MISLPYTIATREADDGTEQPDEHLWTPGPDDATDNGFVAHDGLLIVGVGDEEEPPEEFVALSHGHTWTAMYEAAAAYMAHVYKWRDLHSYPGEEPPAVATPTPLPKRQHAHFLRHPHPDSPCGCEWDGMWRVVYVPADTPGAVAVTTMAHPAGVR